MRPLPAPRPGVVISWTMARNKRPPYGSHAEAVSRLSPVPAFEVVVVDSERQVQSRCDEQAVGSQRLSGADLHFPGFSIAVDPLVPIAVCKHFITRTS